MRALAVLTFVACVASAACAPPKIPSSTDELATMRTAWLAAFNAKQLEPAAQAYALDALYLPITGNRIVSRMAIKNLFAQIWEKLSAHLELTSKVVERSASLAYETGEYTEVLSGAGGSSMSIAGSYVFAYRKDPDGWHFVAQVWTDARPPSQSE